MIRKLRIKNFKCLRDTGDLELRPLTFLVGPNSSGKSSLLQMLLMLRQTVDSTDLDNPLLANNGWVQMGAYPEFIYGGNTKNNLEVNLEFETNSDVVRFGKETKKIVLHVIFSYNNNTTQIELKESKITINDNNYGINISKSKRGKRYIIFPNLANVGQSKKKGKFIYVKPIKFYDFRTIAKTGKSYDYLKRFFPSKIVFFLIFDIRHFIEKEFRVLFYLGPLREYPKRFYVVSGQAPQDVGIKGERAADVLWYSHRSEIKDIQIIENEVRDWFNKFNFANNVQIEPISKENLYRIVVKDPSTGIETNLADIGFGASQTLPIIIESFYTPPDSLILIEQPEIHLHPKAQTTLGDLFIEAVRKNKRNFVIETHSEHILSRIRRRIAEKKIAKEKVAIYYFEPSSDGTHIREVTLNDKGQYKDFPEGFFEEDVMEAFEHLKSIK